MCLYIYIIICVYIYNILYTVYIHNIQTVASKLKNQFQFSHWIRQGVIPETWLNL
jgi:hypothetical protein